MTDENDSMPSGPRNPRDAEDPDGAEIRADRIDLLISSAMDGELMADERAELDALMADEETAVRARALHGVDAMLREVAEQPIAEARLAASFAALRGRLGFDASLASDESETAGSGAMPQAVVASLDEQRRLSRRRVAPIVFAAAAAAAALLYLLAPRAGLDPAAEGSDGVTPRFAEAPSSQSPAEGKPAPAEAALDEEFALVLGYAEDLEEFSEFGVGSSDDLEIVEQLELLDFLAAREMEGRG